jgi:rubrerythrin
MSSSLAQAEVGTEIRNEHKIRNLHEANSRLLQGKIVESVQICIRCGRKYPLKQGRKSCPFCNGLLIAKIMVIKDK